MSETLENTTNWPDLAIGLYDRLTGRVAEITYQFDDMEVAVPSTATDDSSYANWKFNGTIRIKTRDNTH